MYPLQRIRLRIPSRKSSVLHHTRPGIVHTLRLLCSICSTDNRMLYPYVSHHTEDLQSNGYRPYCPDSRLPGRFFSLLLPVAGQVRYHPLADCSRLNMVFCHQTLQSRLYPDHLRRTDQNISDYPPSPLPDIQLVSPRYPE